MKLAVLTPLPPAKSGIAHYSAMLLSEMSKRHDVTAVVDQDDVAFDACPWIPFSSFEQSWESFDAIVCQLGNNLFHEFAWNWARRVPSVIVLHEIVLHHLLVETTLARGDKAAFFKALRDEYGDAGMAIANARAAGLHGEIANFLFPASGRLAEHSRHVIVHNRWAARRLLDDGVTTPIAVAPHPFVEPPSFSNEEISRVRQNAGWGDAHRVIGVFGFVTEAKRPGVVIESFAEALKRAPSLKLVFVGESAPNVDLASLARERRLPDDSWKVTGFVSDLDFDRWLNAVDRVVSLRYPTGGESSGPVVRTLAVGRPLAVNDYAQFADFPDDLVVKIAFDDEVSALTRFMSDDSLDARRVAERQRTWLAANATVSRCADVYDSVLESGTTRSGSATVAIHEGLPLFPRVEVALVSRDKTSTTLRLTNLGEATLRCALWGQPCYAVRARMIETDGSTKFASFSLDRDLHTEESTTITLDSEGPVRTIELRHALSDVPDFSLEPFAVLEIES